MTGLEGFSDWVLALLPRLFIYPGGLWMLVALAGLRLATGGLAAIRPRSILVDLAKALLPSLALAWATLSLLPLPGASPLAAPVDALVLIALVLISFTLDGDAALERERWISVGMALAVLSPVVRGHVLMGYVPAWDASSVISMFCIAVGLARLSNAAQRDLATAVRWLTWAGLGFGPLLSGATQSGAAGVLWTTLIYAVAIVVSGGVAGRCAFAASTSKRTTDAVTIVIWSMAVISLAVALLGY